MDGDVTAHKILKRYKSFKISKKYRPFVVCFSANEDDEEAAKRAGVKGFLTKPVPQDLLAVVIK
jgi:CheY-like chemotaxis protein